MYIWKKRESPFKDRFQIILFISFTVDVINYQRTAHAWIEHEHTYGQRAVIIGEKAKEGRPVCGEGGRLHWTRDRIDFQVAIPASYPRFHFVTCRVVRLFMEQHQLIKQNRRNGGGSSPINWSINSELWVVAHNIVNKGVRSKIRIMRDKFKNNRCLSSY